MSLLTALIVKHSLISARICLLFPKNCLRPNLKGFQYQIWTSVKDWSSSYQVRQIFSNFLQVSCSNFKLNSVKDLRLKKNEKQNKLEGVWGDLEARNCFQRQSFTKYLRQSVVFM